MNYQKLIIAGNITRDAEQKTSRKGDVKFTTFSVAVNDGKDQATFFPVTLFGKLGETLVKHITKGRQVLIEGRVNINDGYFNVVADHIELGRSPKSQNQRAENDDRSTSETPERENAGE